MHWNEGRLPEGRSRVYRAVVRWLIAARTDLRKEAGFSDLHRGAGPRRAAAGKYQVTVEEYQRFVEFRGYEE